VNKRVTDMYGVSAARTLASVRLYVKLARASRAVTACADAGLAQAGLTHTQLGVLEAILHLGPMTQRALGKKVLTSPANLTDLIDKLAARGLLFRCRAETDRRNVVVDLTPEGRRCIEDLFPRHAASLAAAMGDLTDAEITMLDALLRRVGRHAASCSGDETP